MKPKVNSNKCLGCFECIDTCPVDAIKISKKTNKAWINTKICIDCGACIDICPIKCIKRK